MINPEHKNCIGCGACKAVCPVGCIMIKRINGQYMPAVDRTKCTRCNLCENVCVALGSNHLRYKNILCSYLGYAVDSTIRFASSSGGVFYALAQEFVKNNGIVVGASFDHEFNVRHIIADSIDALEQLRGSKYVESNASDIFYRVRSLLEKGQKVLFSGVPCQIGALQTYLSKNYENLICCEVFCHGAPRSGVFNSYLQYLQNKYGGIKSFNFRSKKYGWDNPAYEITTANRIILQEHRKNIYHLMFGYHLSLRDSCYVCQFRKAKRIADISLGDFWGIENYYPFVETKYGVSAILVNSEKGKRLIVNPQLFLYPCQASEIFEKNTWMISHFEKPKEQCAFINDYNNMGSDAFFTKYRIKFFTSRLMRAVKRAINYD